MKIAWSRMALEISRLTYGAMLVAVLFIPFSVYHSMTEPYVAGALWGFYLPVGYIAAASGVAVILYPRSVLLKRLGFGYLLIIIGFFTLASFWGFPRIVSVNLLHGTSFGHGWVDFDSSVGNVIVLILSLGSVVAGFVVKATRIRWHL